MTDIYAAAIADEIESKKEFTEYLNEDIFGGADPEEWKAAQLRPDLSFLKAKTGPGSIDDYLDHALNFHKSRGVAQILRGFTGILGELNLAIVDIVIGTLNTFKEKQTENKNTNGSDNTVINWIK